MHCYLMSSYLASLFANVALAWPTTTLTFSASTETVTGFTDTELAETFTEDSTTITQPATTRGRPDSTITEPATTITEQPVPSQFRSLEVGDAEDVEVLNALANFAPDVTSLPDSVLSKLEADIASYYASYSAQHTAPAILTEAFDYLDFVASTASFDEDLQESIYEDSFPYEPSSMVAELQGLVSPYPTLSSELMAYISAAATYDAPLVLGEGSIVSQDLSLTAAPPSFLSVVSDSLPSATGAAAGSSSSSAGAPASTKGVALAAAAGIVGVALL